MASDSDTDAGNVAPEKPSEGFTWLEIALTAVFWAALYYWIFHTNSAPGSTDWIHWIRYWYLYFYSHVVQIGGAIMAAFGLFTAYSMLAGSGSRKPKRERKLRDLNSVRRRT